MTPIIRDVKCVPVPEVIDLDRSPANQVVKLLRRVDEFSLSTRALKALDARRLTLIGDLVQVNVNLLYKQANVGRKTLEEVASFIGSMGFEPHTAIEG